MSLRGLFGKLKGEVWMDGSRVLLLRDSAFASRLPMPTDAGLATVEPCDKCGCAFEERIITTGGEGSDPEVWDAAPVAVDGWGCPTCEAVRYPRAMSAETSVRFGAAGEAAVRAKKWREAEWWLTRMAWSWPTYAPAYLDLAQALEERLRAGFDSTPEATRRVERRMMHAYERAMTMAAREHSKLPVAMRVAAHLRAAEAAAHLRDTAAALSALEGLRAVEPLDDASHARAVELECYVQEEWWRFTDASKVLGPHLLLQGRANTPITAGAQRAACTKAVEELEAYYAEHPTHWQPIWTAAMGRAALGDTSTAIATWKRAWQAHPERPEIVREAGLALLSANRADEALVIARDATGRIPKDATLWCNRAVVEVLSGNLDEARRCLGECQRLDPDDPIARVLAKRFASLRAEGPLPRTLAELSKR